ncbi:hypothetical protein Hte_006017 [Hypoxylon texense]
MNVAIPSWAPYLSRFLLARPNITNWVESSFSYRLQPTVANLKRAIESVAGDFDQRISESREIHWILHGLNQLDEALTDLCNTFGRALQNTPSLIWQDTITAATDPSFWPVWSANETVCSMPGETGCRNSESYQSNMPIRNDMFQPPHGREQ